MRFMRGKLTPASGVIADVLSGMRDYSGKPITLTDEAIKLTIPLSLREVANQMEKDGTASIFKHTIPSFIGVNVKDKRDYARMDLGKKEFKYLYDSGIKIPSSEKQNLKVKDSSGKEIEVSDEKFEQYVEKKESILQNYISEIMKRGYPTIQNGRSVTLTAEELSKNKDLLQEIVDRYSRKATSKAKEEVFGKKEKGFNEKIEERILGNEIEKWERQIKD